jgi:hypothetical protein
MSKNVPKLLRNGVTAESHDFQITIKKALVRT